ncbi:mucin-17-like [Engraulis encrasicolus]|uniref:mucin-17-like n=1 Tax=Engraulis encrasicolus TaxID=184585 RepID=UPI002FD39B23
MAQKTNMWLRTMIFGGLVCTGIFLFSGDGLRDVILGKRAYDESSFFFYLEITNRTFDNSLLDPSSDYYKSLAYEVEDLMDTVFNCSACSTSQGYGGTSDISFSKGSLVHVKMTLDFYDIPINQFVVKFFFLREVKANPPKYLNINLDYTENVQTPVIATTDETPTTPMATQTTPMATQTTSPMETQTTSPMATQTNSQMPTQTSLPSPVTHMVNNSTVSHSSSHPATRSTNGTSGSSTSIQPTMPTGLPLPTGGSGMSTSAQVITPDHGKTATSSSSTTTTTAATGPDSRQRPYWFDWVPGWAIALLVLAAVTLLLLILLLIALLVRWCCRKEKKPMPVSDPYPPPFNPSSAPSYTSHSPASAPKVLSEDHPEAKRNRTGLYIVNP